jgi:hypothetical protein
MITHRPTRVGDVDYLATRLRPEDEAEVRAASGLEPHAALLTSLKHTVDCRVGVDENDVPMCIGGVVPWDEGRGVIWLLCTPEIMRHRVAFLRDSRAWVAKLQTEFPILTNAVDERNTVHIEWLKWLGFTFIRRIPDYGSERRPFLEFVRIDPLV